MWYYIASIEFRAAGESSENGRSEADRARVRITNGDIASEKQQTKLYSVHARMCVWLCYCVYKNKTFSVVVRRYLCVHYRKVKLAHTHQSTKKRQHTLATAILRCLKLLRGSRFLIESIKQGNRRFHHWRTRPDTNSSNCIQKFTLSVLYSISAVPLVVLYTLFVFFFARLRLYVPRRLQCRSVLNATKIHSFRINVFIVVWPLARIRSTSRQTQLLFVPFHSAVLYYELCEKLRLSTGERVRYLSLKSQATAHIELCGVLFHWFRRTDENEIRQALCVLCAIRYSFFSFSAVAT